MGLTSRAKGRLAVAVVFVAFLVLYLCTLYKGVCPGAPAHNAAMALGLESGVMQAQVRRVEAQNESSLARPRYDAPTAVMSVRTVSAEFRTRHLVWRSLAALAARHLPGGSPAFRLNALSALFGALAVALAFALCRGLVLFINFHDSPVSSGNRKISAMASGVVAAAALGFSAPFWLAATRCSPGTFDALLLLGMGWLLFSASVSQSAGALFAFGVLWGVSLFESDTGVFTSVLLFLFAIRAMIVGGIMSVRSWCNCLVGIIVGVVFYITAAHFLLAVDGSVLLPVKELMASVRVANSLVFGGIFSDTAKLVSVFFVILPFGATCALAMWRDAERNAAASGFLVFLLACTSAIALTKTSISPWGAYCASYPDYLPVTVFVLASATAAYLASSGAILAGGRLLMGERTPGRKRRPNDEISEASVGRLLFWFVLCLCVVAGAINWRELRDSRDSLIATAADQFVDRLDGHAWMASTTDSLDTMVRIRAWERRIPLHIIGHGRGGSAATARLRMAIGRDPAFKGLPLDELVASLASTNLDDFVQSWITHDPEVGRKLLLDEPHLWSAAGRTPVPAVVGFRAQEKGENIDWGALAEDHLAFWRTLAAADSMLGPAASSRMRSDRGELRTYLCGIGESLANQLGKVKDFPAAKIREILDQLDDLREEPRPVAREEVFY